MTKKSTISKAHFFYRKQKNLNYLKKKPHFMVQIFEMLSMLFLFRNFID
jgi:hypothetical protein